MGKATNTDWLVNNDWICRRRRQIMMLPYIYCTKFSRERTDYKQIQSFLNQPYKVFLVE